jgi:hypothetical protein
MSATHITSTIDPRDTPFILGATVNMPTDLCEVESGPLRAQWKADAKLATLEEAFAAASPDQLPAFKTRIAGLNVSRALRVAQELSPGFFWSAESPRTAQGWYAFKGGIDCAISRSLVCAPLVDMTWACVGSYDPKGASQIAAAVQDVYPGKWMAYNITGGFPEDGQWPVRVPHCPPLSSADKGMYRLTRRRSQSPTTISRLAGLRMAIPPHCRSHCRCSRRSLSRTRDQEGWSPGIPSERVTTRWEDRTSLGRVVVEGHGEAHGHGRGCDRGGFVRLSRICAQELSTRRHIQ